MSCLFTASHSVSVPNTQRYRKRGKDARNGHKVAVCRVRAIDSDADIVLGILNQGGRIVVVVVRVEVPDDDVVGQIAHGL